jgi:transcriptional regulator with XRE-family HTH domain
MAIGPLIRDLRLAKGMSLAELAAELCRLSGRDTVTRHDVSRWESGRRSPQVYWRRYLAQALEVTVEDLSPVNRREFVAAAVSVPVISHSNVRRIGIADVTELRERFARLRELDSYAGGGDTYRLFMGELEFTQDVLSHSSHGDAALRELSALAAEQAQQAGWAAFDAGHLATALQLYEYSRQAAEAAENPSLAANALIQTAYATTNRRSVDAAEAACRRVHRTESPQTRALLESRKAWSYAVVGDASKAGASLDAAHAALDEGAGAVAPHWARWMDATELEIMVGRVWALLRAPRRAIPALENALRSYPEQWARDKSLYLTSLADAYLDAGELERSAQVASSAIRLAERVASVRPATRIRNVAGRLVAIGGPGATAVEREAAALRPPIPARL